MKISALATLLFAANAATTHAAETKQHVRKAEGEAEKLAEAIEENLGYGLWDKFKPHTCSHSSFSIGPLDSVGSICTIVPALSTNPNQPGAPVGTDGAGVFCTGQGGEDNIGPYTLEIETVPTPVGVSNLIRITLDLAAFEQEEAPNGDRRLQGGNPLLDPAVNGGEGRPNTTITFQGTMSSDCSFRAVSTQGGLITGNMDNWSHSGHTSVNVDFTQSGQVTSPLNSLGGQFTNVVGLFVSNFAFAFSGTFDDHF